MGYPGRHSDADDVAVTSPGKSFEERFEKLEKMHQAQNDNWNEKIRGTIHIHYTNA